MDPPSIEWEKLYGSVFYDVQETTDGNYVVVGSRWYNYSRTIFLYSPSGDKLWESSVYPYNLVSNCVIQLDSGDFVATGYGISDESSSQYSLSLYKISSDGQALWSKIYELEDDCRSYGQGVVQLADGGFAVCGNKDPAQGLDNAWILRTDAQGDTLWTREWGWEAYDTARAILSNSEGVITVLARGRLEGASGGTYILRYDIDGNLLSEYQIEDLIGEYGEDLCQASGSDLYVLTNYWPIIAKTNYMGYYDWQFSPPSASQPCGWSVDTTMDGGIIYGGENNIDPDIPGSQNSGMISRHDYEGNELWRDYIYNSGCQSIFAVRQLSQGGYIAAGRVSGSQGILIKYAPELGIENQNDLPVQAISSVSPNPISTSTAIDFSLLEAGDASLTLYDLNGRVVSNISEGVFSEGNNTIEWNSPDDLSSGCYLLMLSSASGNATKSIVILR